MAGREWQRGPKPNNGLRVSLSARADLREIWNYIEEGSGSSTVADRFMDSLRDRFRLLSEWPLIGRARNDLRTGLRTSAVGDYLIFYRLENSDVVIQRVLHGRRNLPALFRR